MIGPLIAILLFVWVLGLIFHIAGAFIHLALIAAGILLIAWAVSSFSSRT